MEKHTLVCDVRGKGLIRGMEFTVPAGPIAGKCIENGVLLITAGEKTIRFVPPLVISKADVDEMIAVLDAAIEAVEKDA
jgi:acetylornithine/succinyldiaminopimelate/putrescine aminotransferase